jgi:hypothetical protein
MDPNGSEEGSSKMCCGQCHVLRWMGLIIQCVYGSFWEGTQGNGYSKKYEDSFLSFHPSSRRYSPGWALASSTTILHCSLSFVFSIHCFFVFSFTLQNLADALCTTKSDTKQVNVLPTQCIGVFWLDIRSNRDYFPVQHLTDCYFLHGRWRMFTARYELNLQV